MNLLLIFLGFILLVIGGEFIVRSSVAISLKFNLSKLIIGMTVVAFATSLPELVVSVNAALNDSPSIAINNVIGSNIANIGLVLALIAILSNISVDNNFYRKDWPVMFIFSIILYFFVFNDKLLEKYEGVILVLSLFLFIYYFLRKSKTSEVNDQINNKLSLVSNFKIFLWLIISTISLYYGAEFLVEGAVCFAKQINISEAVISVTIISVGTSVPELAASLVAIAKNEKGISVGNLIGSNIFNIGSVLGITAIISDIPVQDEIINRDIICMLIFALMLLIFAILPKKNQLSKYKGLIMMLGYFSFIFLAFS
tara:strand:+ start:22639 stop:23574 length:936 start_codon:yes stop_codon:yes gene_type:complete